MGNILSDMGVKNVGLLALYDMRTGGNKGKKNTIYESKEALTARQEQGAEIAKTMDKTTPRIAATQAYGGRSAKKVVQNTEDKASKTRLAVTRKNKRKRLSNRGSSY